MIKKYLLFIPLVAMSFMSCDADNAAPDTMDKTEFSNNDIDANGDTTNKDIESPIMK